MADLAEDTSEWLTVSALARRRGVDKAAISRRVARLEAAGALTTRAGERGTKLINVAEFDRVAGETVDAVREANGRRPGAARDGEVVASGGLLSRAQASKTAAQARLAHLDLAERLGQLLPLEKAQQGARNAAERLRRGVDQMPARAEEVASALAKDSPFARALLDALRADPQGARSFFRSLAREQLAELARLATAFNVLSEDRSAEDMCSPDRRTVVRPEAHRAPRGPKREESTIMPLQTERGVKKAVAQAIADAMRKGREQGSDQALQAEATEAPPVSLVEELSRLGRYEEALAQLDIEERKGLWLPRDKVKRAVEECHEVLERVANEVMQRFEPEVLRAASEGGAESARASLTRFRDELFDEWIRALTRLASDA